MKIFHLNYSDAKGGAARSAFRLNNALKTFGFDSRLFVDVATSGDWSVQGPNNNFSKAMGLLRPQIVKPFLQLLSTNNPIIHSPSILPSSWPHFLNTSDADVVNLHWVQAEMLSIRDISLIKKPIVWTLHDMWAFCGAEHLSWDSRWEHGYTANNRPAHESGLDINRYTWQRKRKYWVSPINIVTPSRWLADCVRDSALMHSWPVSVIPNCIDLSSWSPKDKYYSRKIFNLPPDCRLVLFGAIGGTSSHHKGFDLLIEALIHLRQFPSFDDLEFVILGQVKPEVPPKLGYPIHYMGHLHDDVSLSALYSAVDLFVVPSRQDNLPNTAIESHACGTPVVAFNTCGLPDIVSHKITGYLAEPFDTVDLAHGIKWVLESSERCKDLRYSARSRAEALWSPSSVSKLYQHVYAEAISLRHLSHQLD